MAVILETGGGVRTANAYASVAFVTAYLTELNRNTDWDAAGTTVQDAAVLAATSYIDTRWRSRFKGVKLRVFDGVSAQGLASFNANPSADDTFTAGSITYTYKAALTTLSQYQIEIESTLAETVQATIDAINSGIPNLTPANSELLAALADGSTDAMILTAALQGESGNDIPLSSSLTGGGALTPFQNGIDAGSQPLEFPRNGLYNYDGQPVIGIPLKLKQAMAEYADRAQAALLYNDPTVDATGKVVTEKFTKVGPIEEQTKYSAGGALDQLLTPYPAADRLLNDYLFPAGRVSRG